MPFREMRASSAIERVGYNPVTHELSIWFAGRRRYIYSDVPAEVYHALSHAESAGSYVSRAVKGRYPCRCDPPRRRYPD